MMQLGFRHVADNLLWQTVVVTIITLLVFKFAKRNNDPYGMYHIPLNVRPGDTQNNRPDTEWLNMGYWKDTHIFPEACEALALKLIRHAKCVSGGHLLDVGHACGDSLLLHLRHPDVPRPATLTGVTILRSHHNRTAERVAKCQSSPLAHPCEVKLYCNDAVFRPQYPDHPLNPASRTPTFTSIIALDCAYHFASRNLFLRQSYARLSRGGTIALGDLAVSKPLPLSLRMVLTKLLSVPSENVITPNEYEEQLKTIGYVNVRMEDISDCVFPEFRLFLKSKGGLWWLIHLVIRLWVAAGGKFLLVSASKPEAI